MLQFPAVMVREVLQVRNKENIYKINLRNLYFGHIIGAHLANIFIEIPIKI